MSSIPVPSSGTVATLPPEVLSPSAGMLRSLTLPRHCSQSHFKLTAVSRPLHQPPREKHTVYLFSNCFTGRCLFLQKCDTSTFSFVANKHMPWAATPSVSAPPHMAFNLLPVDDHDFPQKLIYQMPPFTLCLVCGMLLYQAPASTQQMEFVEMYIFFPASFLMACCSLKKTNLLLR
jgi:hypothetical protein